MSKIVLCRARIDQEYSALLETIKLLEEIKILKSALWLWMINRLNVYGRHQNTNLNLKKLKILHFCMEIFVFNNSCPVFEDFLIKKLFKGLLISFRELLWRVNSSGKNKRTSHNFLAFLLLIQRTLIVIFNSYAPIYFWFDILKFFLITLNFKCSEMY